VIDPGRRVAAIIEYDGTDYAGWQSQVHSVSIQDAVEKALSFVAGHPIIAICAGRTDAGVHAVGQVVHFDTHAERTPRAWVLGANTKLAPSIARYQIPRFFEKRTDQQLLRTNLELERSAQQRAHELSLINAELERDIAERAGCHKNAKRMDGQHSCFHVMADDLLSVEVTLLFCACGTNNTVHGP